MGGGNSMQHERDMGKHKDRLGPLCEDRRILLEQIDEIESETSKPPGGPPDWVVDKSTSLLPELRDDLARLEREIIELEKDND
jgi:hypothetical protein